MDGMLRGGIARSDLNGRPLQTFQTNYIRKVSALGTPKGMLWLDSQRPTLKWRIIHLKLRAIAKTMGKNKDN